MLLNPLPLSQTVTPRTPPLERDVLYGRPRRTQDPQFSNSNPRPTVFNPDRRHCCSLHQRSHSIGLHFSETYLGAVIFIFRHFVLLQLGLYLSHSNTQYVKREVIFMLYNIGIPFTY